MNNPVDRAMAGAASAPLTNEQKRDIVLLARKAFARQRDIGALGPEADGEVWRRIQMLLVVERRSLTTCVNADYAALKAHFLALSGNEVRAQAVALKAGCEDRTWALAKLRNECVAAADVMPRAFEYAAGFLRNARGVTIDEASAKQLWHAVFVVRRRTQQLRRAAHIESTHRDKVPF